jgi:hypothetical protein
MSLGRQLAHPSQDTRFDFLKTAEPRSFRASCFRLRIASPHRRTIWLSKTTPKVPESQRHSQAGKSLSSPTKQAAAPIRILLDIAPPIHSSET